MTESALPTRQPARRNLVDKTIEVTSKLLSYSFAIAVVVTIYDVVRDVLFSAPTVWVYDVVTTAIAVAFLIGGSYALARREHIRITALYDRYPRRIQLSLDIVTSILAIAYLATFAWFSWNMASLAVENWELGGSAWAQPTPVIVKVSMLIGALLMIIQALANLLRDLAALREAP